MGSQLYRCFACNSKPFHASGSNPSCSECESPDAVARIVEIHMISEVEGGPINNKYIPLCCGVRPRYFTNSEGGITCLTCLEIIRKAEAEKVEEVKAVSKQTSPDDVTTKDLPASLVGPHLTQKPAEEDSSPNEPGSKPLEEGSSSMDEEIRRWEASDRRSDCKEC